MVSEQLLLPTQRGRSRGQHVLPDPAPKQMLEQEQRQKTHRTLLK